MLRVHLVGELRLDVDGRPLPAIPSRRARSLLGWLALHPGLHPRSRVAAVFWPDVLEHSSRGSLRTTLATLRRALGPHADVLVGGRADVGLDGAASVDTREIDRLVAADRLEDALALCDGEHPVVVDELTRLLPELGPAGSAPAGSPEDARHRLLEAVAAAIGGTARRGAVLLVIEDLHWADAATVGMLGHVVRTVGWAPLLVAGSRRDDEPGEAALGDLLDELGRAHRLERVAVPGLSAQEAGRLAGAWLHAEPARALADVLHRRTGGNPLFVEALARHLVESHPEDGADLAAAAGTEVPEGVRAVIDRRLARLPADAVGAVRLGAVAGEDFLLDDVARAGAVDIEATAEALEAAVAAGLVDAGGGPARYRFAHALVREAVLAGLSSTRRALLHRRMADALAERPHRLPERARHLLDARPLADADVAARAALAAASS